jgi:hypothetical protein
MKASSERDIFSVISNEWRRWFRKFKWLPGEQQQTWTPWFGFLRTVFGMPLSESDLALFQKCSGRSDVPAGGFTRAWLCCGRRSGKSRMLAMIAAYLGCFRDWTPYLSPGEVPTVIVVAADKKQGRTIFKYCREFIKALKDVSIERETMDTLELSNGVSIEIMAADFRTLRSYTTVAVLLDEVAFWQNAEGSSNPDSEIIKALTPSMATIPGAMMLCASSPYAKRGVLFDAFREHYGRDGDDVLFWRAPTRIMNPSVPESFIASEFAKDPVSAASEYGAEFRDDISSFIPAEIIDAAILKGKAVLEPRPDLAYHAFCDISGGVHDGHALAVAFKDADGTTTLAAAREIKSSNTESVVAEFAAVLKSYGVDTITGDRYGQHWVLDAFARHGITMRHSIYDRSGLYLNLVPALTSGQVKILDIPRLRSQLVALERRITRATGKEVIDHPGAGADDLANAVAGALVLAYMAERNKIIWVGASDNWNQYLQDADPEAPRLDEPFYQQMKRIRNTVRINGNPLPWSEIRAKVLSEQRFAA